MIKNSLSVLLCFLFPFVVNANTKVLQDTIQANGMIADTTVNHPDESIPTITLDDVDDAGGSQYSDQNVASVLTAGRDPFYSAATFSFGVARFKIRGYNNDQFETYINGAPTEFIDNGFSSYNIWAGLNDVTRNRENVLGIRASTFGYGALGGAYNIDVRASRQRKQLQVSTSFSNRSYDNRVMLTYGSGISKKGWSYAISASGRISKEGYIKGTYLKGVSYFFSVEKFIKNHAISLSIMGAPTQTAKTSAATQEAYDLVGSNYYNPNWGYQDGKVRNARVENRHQPLFTMTHEWKIKESDNLMTTVGYSFGERSNSGLDWFNSADPRPDYYRYLPSYYENIDPAQAAVARDYINQNPELLQINWDNLYAANKGQDTARYIVRDDVEKIQRVNFQSVYNKSIKRSSITVGVTYQYLKRNVFGRVRDLLGAKYWMDIDEYAQQDNQDDPAAYQSDLNNPNRQVKEGEKYGYDVDIKTHKTNVWAQLVQKFNHLDFFVAAEFSNSVYWRVGNYKNGLFPNNSFGKSKALTFYNYSVKAGLTYKIDGRNYLYANTQIETKAPYFDNIYVSYRTRDFHLVNPKNEQVYSAEAGYILNSPRIKLRVSGYFTKFNNGSDMRVFYDDAAKAFSNISLTNIDKIHYGGELGAEVPIYKGLSASVVVAVGRYYYSDRMTSTTYIDNSNEIYDPNTTVYSKGFQVGGAPQQAYTLGLNYRSPKFWYVGANVNFFDGFYTDFSPVRRTEKAVDLVPYQSANWYNITNQERYNKKGQWTLDLSGGYNWRLKSTFKKMHGKNSGKYYIYLNAGISNITNNKKFITNAYEQLRFDFTDKNVNKFANKYSYAYGITYFINLGFRM